MRMYPKAKVSEKAERALKGGHPWVYAEEVLSVDGDYTNGGLVDVYTKKDRFIGTGFINDNSKIRIRIFSRNANDANSSIRGRSPISFTIRSLASAGFLLCSSTWEIIT